MRGDARSLIVALVVLSAAGCAKESARWTSPDGRFDVVVYATFTLAPAMPGQGSDGPGEVDIVRRSDGTSCGRAPLEIRYLAREIRFEGDHARIPIVADWDLRTCTVTLVGPH